jgi:hypothetical protein
MVNRQKRPIEIITKYSEMVNISEPKKGWQKDKAAPDDDPKKKNPDAAATATGSRADQVIFISREYLERAQAATALCNAVRACHREDAERILLAVLESWRQGAPLPSLMQEIMADARWWAGLASLAELKAYCLACFTRLPETDKRGFLAYVAKGGVA